MATQTATVMNTAHIVTTREIGTETVGYAAGRTSKGNDTHIVNVHTLGGFGTFCGLNKHTRVQNSVWTIAKTQITCEKCNGTKMRGKPSDIAARQAFAALFN